MIIINKTTTTKLPDLSIAEYKPRGGWYNYNRRRQLLRKRLKAFAASMIACCIYAAFSTLYYYL